MIKPFIISIAVVAMLLTTACAPKTYYNTSIGYINYSKYSESGIFLTESNSVNFDYTPLGSVSVTILSGNVKKTRPNRYNYVDYNYVDAFGNLPDEKYTEWVVASPEEAIHLATQKAMEQGGNGIINLKFEPITHVVDSKHPQSGILLTGMVIRK